MEAIFKKLKSSIMKILQKMHQGSIDDRVIQTGEKKSEFQDRPFENAQKGKRIKRKKCA